MIACCMKQRKPCGTQKRWSILAYKGQVHSTQKIAIYHQPQDECGGGSAWSAGMIDYFLKKAYVCNDLANPIQLLRTADLLAALTQESSGDQSTVTLEMLNQYDTVVCDSEIHLERSATLDEKIKGLKNAGVIAIIRGKNAEVAISRGIELAEMGCKAIEITLDSEGFEEVLSSLARHVGNKCLVGVGTVMSAKDIPTIARLGAKFALSPINPKGMIRACLDYNVVPVPAAYTPQEIFDAYSEGAKCIKLFPAQLWNPKTLKALLDVGEFGDINIIPSGGITPQTAKEWLEAGAFAVGMGSNLAGRDVKCPASDPVALKAAQEHWQSTGKMAAQRIIEALAN